MNYHHYAEYPGAPGVSGPEAILGTGLTGPGSDHRVYPYDPSASVFCSSLSINGYYTQPSRARAGNAFCSDFLEVQEIEL